MARVLGLQAGIVMKVIVLDHSLLHTEIVAGTHRHIHTIIIVYVMYCVNCCAAYWNF